MALSEELPIYKSAYDLLEKMIELAKELPKFYRYTLGTRMVDLNLDILGQIYRANMSKEKRREALTNWYKYEKKKEKDNNEIERATPADSA